MKAALLREFKAPLSIEEIERPSPESQEVLIQVEACGACHSDVHVADGDWTQLAGIIKRPLILGHEIAGRIVEKGSAVGDLEIGDRVGVPWIHWSCGDCEFCREGNENLCSRQKITGVTVDGGYAEFVKAPASHSVRIPHGISAIEAAPLFCAALTVYRALKHAGPLRSRRLAVFGVGGLGHLAVQLALAFGAEVAAIDAMMGAWRTMSAGPEIFTLGGAILSTSLPAGVPPSSRSSTLARPQSITWISPKLPTMILPGSRSQWITPRAWA